ncbi:uncharacterized protein AKAW2_40329S [Aspergillus luchuensis]|uniref:Uncharacterized protein n=1 Tax=Aspergillus kawachii TaxID=1069201 RepID=A0A7R7ZYZ2_ASPKA|nr:uncharacterized protein AKAW2_40329S [Aspergillus luchuensis]BCR98646.1 hypothetical protein AKAW2_40329S [Aspergillus luchuensis]
MIDSALHDIIPKGWITHDVQLYTTTSSDMSDSLNAIHWSTGKTWTQLSPGRLSERGTQIHKKPVTKTRYQTNTLSKSYYIESDSTLAMKPLLAYQGTGQTSTVSLLGSNIVVVCQRGGEAKHKVWTTTEVDNLCTTERCVSFLGFCCKCLCRRYLIQDNVVVKVKAA